MRSRQRVPMKKRRDPVVTQRDHVTDGVRINRFLSMCGIASRRKAEELIRTGAVRINGVVVTDLGTRVDPSRDKVFVNGSQAARVHDYLYLVMNKPKDAITTAKDERGRTTVMDLLRSKQRVFPVGRLDRNTTGVLLFTNDGEFANRMMHPRHAIAKSYRVTCSTAVLPEHLRQLRHGIQLDDGMTAAAHVQALPGGKGKEIGIVIHEGRNRQVHRMFDALGYEVVRLERVAYGPITNEGMKRGETRSLSKREIRALKVLAGMDTEPS